MTSGDFEYGPVADQIASILNENASGQTAFSYDDAPRALNREDLPSTLIIPGPTSRNVDREVGSRASCYLLMGVALEMVVYLMPVTQGLVGDAARLLTDLTSDIYDAFDSRPKLVNAEGLSEAQVEAAGGFDFDFDDAGVRRAQITDFSGLVVRPYGKEQYFARVFTLMIDARRSVDKVYGN